MLALALEITVVVAWFIWAYRRQARARRRAHRLPPAQLRLPFGEGEGCQGSLGLSPAWCEEVAGKADPRLRHPLP